MALDDEKKKKKKGRFSFLRSLASLGSKKPTKPKGDQVQWKGQAGSYFENKKSKLKKLEEASKYW